jgi:hypothetical protein
MILHVNDYSHEGEILAAFTVDSSEYSEGFREGFGSRAAGGGNAVMMTHEDGVRVVSAPRQDGDVVEFFSAREWPMKDMARWFA